MAGQAEADLDFGLVDQLLRAAGDVSRPVLLAAGNGSPASSFAVGAHLLDVVGEQGAKGPVAIVVDDLQWADRKSLEALTFMLRRLSVDPVVAVVIYRGRSDGLDWAAQRVLRSIENRAHIPLGGLDRDEVAALAAALTGPLDEKAVQRLYLGTGGHPLYLRTVLAEGSAFDPRAPGRLTLPRSLAAAVGDHLRVLPPEEPSCPVVIRHLLLRDAIYAGITPARRRMLHARAALLVSESSSWEHRVATLDKPDEDLAAELERLAAQEAADGRISLAATHLQWSSDISPARAARERRLLLAVLHLMLAEETQSLALREAVEATSPSPLRDLVLGRMANFSGQLAEAERHPTEALAQARAEPDSGPLAALIASSLAGTYLLMGDGEKGLSLGRWALGTGRLDPLAANRTRVLIAAGALEVAGPAAALAEFGHLDADPAHAGPLDVECLAWRGAFRLVAGDLDRAVTDMTAALKMVRGGALLTLSLHPYAYLALAQYLAGGWDDALLTCEQAFAAAAVRSRRSDLPLLHLAAACVPAGRGQAQEAERHALRAEEAAASLDYSQERPYAATVRALVAQAAGDYLGMADTLESWQDDSDLDERSRGFAVLWRPLLAEGLVGSGQTGPAAAVLDQLRENAAQVRYLQPALAWLEGWLAEQQGDTGRAQEIYARGEQAADTQSPVHTARLLLAHGRLLRRTGQRRMAVERLRRANDVYLALRAAPFLARTEAELAACHLPGTGVREQTVLALTSRENEVAHLVGKGLSNPEIAAELFISRKAVEYHLSNVYAKCGLQGRNQLRRFVERWRQPAVI